MALQDSILPFIPPRTSSHRQSSSGTASLFHDDSGASAFTADSAAQSPYRHTRAGSAGGGGKRVSAIASPSLLYGETSSPASTSPTATRTGPGSSYSNHRLPSGAGATRFPFKAKSAYFPSSHTEFQASIAGASSSSPSNPQASPPSRSSQRFSSPPLATSSFSPPRETARPKSSARRPSEGKDKVVMQGNGPFEPPPNFGERFIEGKRTVWPKEKERILLGPYEYLYGHPGKDIRAQLISAFNMWLKVPKESLAIITKVVGMLHTASLLVDDVEDSSLLRRGNPVAHSIFGTAQTINSANYVYFQALQLLTQLPHANLAIHIYTEELLNLHRGQGMDLYWRDSLTCPTEDDYLEMVSNKTGGLFRLAIKLMQAESPLSGVLDFIPLVTTIGLLFQILDDLLNLSSPTYTQRKGLCEDLTEGKFSFPIIHAIRADPGNLVLLNVLKQKTTDEEVKRYAVSYMERMGSFSYSRKVLGVLEGKAFSLVRELEIGVGGEEGKQGAEAIRGILGILKGL